MPRMAFAPSRALLGVPSRSEEHTSELQSPDHLVCRLLLEKKKYLEAGRLDPWVTAFAASRAKSQQPVLTHTPAVRMGRQPFTHLPTAVILSRCLEDVPDRG